MSIPCPWEIDRYVTMYLTNTVEKDEPVLGKPHSGGLPTVSTFTNLYVTRVDGDDWWPFVMMVRQTFWGWSRFEKQHLIPQTFLGLMTFWKTPIWFRKPFWGWWHFGKSPFDSWNLFGGDDSTEKYVLFYSANFLSLVLTGNG